MKRSVFYTLFILMMVIVVQTAGAVSTFDASNKKVDVDSAGTEYNDPLAQNLFGKDGPFGVTTSSSDTEVDQQASDKKDDKDKPADTEEAQAPEVETVKVEATTVTVKSGDSLSAIAQKIYGDPSRYKEIIEANKDKYPSLVKNPDLIHPGWELIIPSQEKEVAKTEQIADATKADVKLQGLVDEMKEAGYEINSRDDLAIAVTKHSAKEGKSVDPKTWELLGRSDTKIENGEVLGVAEKANAPEVKEDVKSSSSVAKVAKIPNLSTAQKLARLQKAVNAAESGLLAKRWKITSITPAVIRYLIEEGFLTEEEWMAMNPPKGYRWGIDKQGKVLLLSANGNALTPETAKAIDEKAEKAAKAAAEKTIKEKIAARIKAIKEKAEKAAKADKDKKDLAARIKAIREKAEKAVKDAKDKEELAAKIKAIKEKALQDEKDAKAKETKKAKAAAEKAAKEKAEKDQKAKDNASKAAAEKLANSKYHKMLSEMGMPDLTVNKRDYDKAISAGSKFLSKGAFGGTTSFYKFYRDDEYPDYNMTALQAELKSAQKRYQKAVESKKTNRFLGIFGDTIESTSKLVLKKQAILTKRWAELKKAIAESNSKAKILEAKVKNGNIAKLRLEKELSKLDAYEASNGKKIQAFNEAIKKIDKANEDDNEKLGYYKTLTKTFK